VVLVETLAVVERGVPVRLGEAKGDFKSSAACRPEVLPMDKAASAIAVALPVDVTTPVRLALVVTDPAVRLAAVPEAFVRVMEVGVPPAPLIGT